MAIFSRLSRGICWEIPRIFIKSPSNHPPTQLIQKWMSTHNTFTITPSRWQYKKFKDLLHFYFFVGAIPAVILVFFTNVFIGPATLAEIPEGYVPQEHEYYRHPITRFLVKHFYQSHQEQYETHMHYLARYMDKKMLRNLQKDVVYQMKQHADYKAFYFRPVMAKYYRELRQEYEYLESIMGEK